MSFVQDQELWGRVQGQEALARAGRRVLEAGLWFVQLALLLVSGGFL